MEGESIFNWIKKEAPPPPKPERYQSKYDPTAPVGGTLRIQKKSAGTFGTGSKVAVDPKRFLKRGQKMGKGVDPKSKPEKFVRASGKKKPVVPSRNDRPIYGLQTTKNFVVANAVENILAIPSSTEAQEPDFLSKPDYGKAPEYLSQVKDDIAYEREIVDAMLLDTEEPEEKEESTLSEEERTELLKLLKDKWNAVNKRYQLMTFKRISSSNSSIGAIRRKENCEKELAQLEADIEKLSRGRVVVVNDRPF